MKEAFIQLKPQDVVLLIKVASLNGANWKQVDLAEALELSQSEISEATKRCQYAGLLKPDGKRLMKLAVLDFLQFGLPYVFPQKPGALVRGVPTSHSAYPLSEHIASNEVYVWPYAKGTSRGQGILPLYPTVPKAALKDPRLHSLLALLDALRVGRAREKEIAVSYLKNAIMHGE